MLEMVGVELMHVALKELVATIITQHAGSSSNTIAVSEAIAALSQLPMLLEELFDLRSNTVTLLAPSQPVMPTLEDSAQLNTLLPTPPDTTDKHTSAAKAAGSFLLDIRLDIILSLVGCGVFLLICVLVAFIHKRTTKRYEQHLAQTGLGELRQTWAGSARRWCLVARSKASGMFKRHGVLDSTTSSEFEVDIPSPDDLAVESVPSDLKIAFQRRVSFSRRVSFDSPDNDGCHGCNDDQASGSRQCLGSEDNTQALNIKERLERARNARATRDCMRQRLESSSERTRTMLAQQIWLVQTLRQNSELFTQNFTNDECVDPADSAVQSPPLEARADAYVAGSNFSERFAESTDGIDTSQRGWHQQELADAGVVQIRVPEWQQRIDGGPDSSAREECVSSELTTDNALSGWQKLRQQSNWFQQIGQIQTMSQESDVESEDSLTL